MESDKKIVNLNLDDILPNRFQPRIKFDEKAINELAGSIKEHGVIQPILVREIGDKYEIIAGERRYKASTVAGLETIPAIINNLNDQDSAEVALIENIQRKDLTPIEEAVSYKKILDMGYLNQESLANKIDRNQSTISNKLRLLNLDDSVQDALLDNKISERHARSLLRLSDKTKQQEMLNRIISERLTVRRTDEEIDKILDVVKNPEENRNEEIKMNNTSQKDIFNMPSAPIIEDIEIFDDFEDIDNQPTPISASKKDIPETNFKPGFLDIDKIEKNAEEIHVEKPVADLDSLLKSDDQFTDLNPIQNDPIVEPQVTQGKFFSFVNNDVNNFETAEYDDGKFNDFDFKLDDVVPTQISKDEDIIDESVITEEPLKPEINYSVENEVKPTQNNEFSNSNYFDNIQPDYNFNFDDETSEEVIEDPKVVVEEVDTFGPNYNIPSVNDLDSSSVVNNPGNFQEVIMYARNCGKKIEELGYFIDVDEVDFGDNYQITFKISKIK
ncbi:MAG: ParB/RepB/Spo0J family partition protein [Bacilli bacterium]|nr:ParB/RepB/Spo0J family partition protein [Bacilli bacterium]MDD4547254.1 ParB/RepB/Spo0J family partition protein [Bacilli bacterium]